MNDLTESKVEQQEESKQEQQQVVIVTRLETNDVVMGRGAQAVAHQGNISFREIVSSRRQEVCVLSIYASIGLFLLLYVRWNAWKGETAPDSASSKKNTLTQH
jgi:hypothetical protein